MRTAILAVLLGLGACTTTEDFDQDGFPLGEDCSDTDPSLNAPTLFYVDGDGDGWGSDERAEACFPTHGLVEIGGDCDDADWAVNPGAVEYCNDVDDDCDAAVDEDHDKGGWYADADGDGYGDPAAEVASCTGIGLVDNALDCDDASDAVRPGAEEVCNGVDDDCDGHLDENAAADATDWTLDADGDGFGDDATAVLACAAPGPEWTTQGGDCDDTRAETRPGADEVCNDLDDDCDGTVDGAASLDALPWYSDADGDGYGDPVGASLACDAPADHVANDLDCDDADRAVNPDTPWYLDTDADGYGDAASSTLQCTQPSGYVADSADCDDADGAVNPGATEVCDALDNDCDGLTDGATAVDASTWYADLDGDGYGNVDNTGVACEAPPSFVADATDCDDLEATVHPGATELCDELDNDCDSLVDYDDPGVTSLTWYLDADDDGYGLDSDTTLSCEVPEGYAALGGDCDDADEDVNPGAVETCDAGLDNDCDGYVDLDDPDVSGDGTWYLDADGDGYGDGDLTTTSCVEPSGYVRNDDDCLDSDATVYNTCWSGERVFTTCGATGYSGPTQSECDTDYSGTTLDSEVTVSGGIQEWTVPWDGTYVITLTGAQGHSADSRYDGGLGAEVQGSFDLEEGEVLYILVGQEGTGDGCSGGGGGGSFVVDADDEPLIIAGGGAGTRTSVVQDGCDGLAGTYGGQGSGSSSSSSCPELSSDEGEGGAVSAYSWGSGGGGFDSNGSGEYYSSNGGRSWANGATGGNAVDYTSTSYTAWGGFGGGGSGNGSCGGGGGGGYSGGEGGRLAGGGGSYNAGDDSAGTDGVQEGDGEVSIDLAD